MVGRFLSMLFLRQARGPAVLVDLTGGFELTSYLVRPKVAARGPVPVDVPAKYAEDYTEACLVLADSAKASAA